MAQVAGTGGLWPFQVRLSSMILQKGLDNCIQADVGDSCSSRCLGFFFARMVAFLLQFDSPYHLYRRRFSSFDLLSFFVSFSWQAEQEAHQETISEHGEMIEKEKHQVQG